MTDIKLTLKSGKVVSLTAEEFQELKAFFEKDAGCPFLNTNPGPPNPYYPVWKPLHDPIGPVYPIVTCEGPNLNSNPTY